MPTFNSARVRQANDRPPATQRDYVLYWMQGSRRLDRNHAFDYAVAAARTWNKPVIVYEGLRLDYPWANARNHRFMLDGMVDNAAKARSLGVCYWPFVETPDQPARGLLRSLAKRACAIITDDYPAFVVPGQIANLAARVDVPVTAIDANSIVPLASLGAVVSAAAHLRPRIHKLFAEAWAHRAHADVQLPTKQVAIDPPFAPFDLSTDLEAFIRDLPIDQAVQPVPGIKGGPVAAHAALERFLADKLPRYADGRNEPNDPARTAASGLSPYLRHGHLSIQEVIERSLTIDGDWSPDRLNLKCRGKREGYYHSDGNVNSFLDEAITWRDVGYHWHYGRNASRGPVRAQTVELHGEKVPAYQTLEGAIPEWALTSLRKHTSDAREHLYSLQEFEKADTHDDLWNAAQRELVLTGRIHNYLRMLWGKKVLEWSKTPDEAYHVLEHLNNKYAVDGRDPNSYTGILWTFGLFDRPWPPERKVFGSIRFMSSANTAKKFDLDGYFEYVARLEGKARKSNSLF